MSARLDRRDVLLFVDSEKVIRTLPPDAQDPTIRALRENGSYTFWGAGYAGHGAISGGTLFDAGRFGNKPVKSRELTDAENDAIHLVWRVLHEKGRTLHIVDVGKESALRRVIQEHLHHLRTFPVLVRPDGRRLEGLEEFTLENLEKFLSDEPEAR